MEQQAGKITEFRSLPFGTRVEFNDGHRTRRGRISGLIEPQMPQPVREGAEFYPGGYLVGRYRVTPAWGHKIRAL